MILRFTLKHNRNQGFLEPTRAPQPKCHPRTAYTLTASCTSPSLLMVTADGDSYWHPHRSASVERGPCMPQRPGHHQPVRGAQKLYQLLTSSPPPGASASGAWLGCWLVPGPHPLTWLKHLLWDFLRERAWVLCV